jgi:hypothetical protein
MLIIAHGSVVNGTRIFGVDDKVLSRAALEAPRTR